MSGIHPTSEKGPFQASVLANKRIRERLYRLRLEFSGAGAKAFADFRPGRFIQLDVSSTALPPAEAIPEDLADAAQRQILLRRPFSFADVAVEDDKVIAELLYHVVGPATLRMTTLSAGKSVSIIGPLGNGFTVSDGKTTALLVTGGMGAPPILYMAKILAGEHPDIKTLAFAGAKTREELPFESLPDDAAGQPGLSVSEFARYGVKCEVATDDGSAGLCGFVTDCLSEWLEKSRGPRESMIIYACGPEAMLAKVAEIAGRENIDCQVSMERRMACGIGLCQSCTVKCRVAGSEETVYKLCCEDGPVFDAKEVVFAEEKYREFLSEKCPNTWKMFNKKAKGQIPKGFIKFLSEQSEDKEMEKHLLNADKTIKSLLCIVGEREVANKYGKKISTIETEHGLAELLCEIKVVESLARISEQKPELQPGTKMNNKKCEIKIVIDNTEIYVEVKRYEDKGPGGKRVLNKRSTEIFEKINDVPDQFPDDTLNILFIFHSGYGSNPLYICQVLFGENACTVPDGDAEYAENDGLFSSDSWSKISGCAYTRISENNNLSIVKLWQNPRAINQIPEKVIDELKKLS